MERCSIDHHVPIVGLPWANVGRLLCQVRFRYGHACPFVGIGGFSSVLRVLRKYRPLPRFDLHPDALIVVLGIMGRCHSGVRYYCNYSNSEDHHEDLHCRLFVSRV